MMTEAEKKFENDFFDRKIKYMDLFKQKKYEEAWDFCLHTFDMFPEPVYEHPLAYLLVEDTVKYSIETQQYEIGNKFAPLLLITGEGRCDDGARELWIGKLAYEQNKLIVAKQFIRIAYAKNRGKYLFKGKENEKYKKFAQGIEIGTGAETETAQKVEEKALKQELQGMLDQLIAQGEGLLASGKNEAAREKYFEALELIPQPKGAYYEATWLYAAIGDTYLSEENFEDALDYFMEAYYAVNGSMNPYVLYMTGKCNYETGSMEEAKKYFRLAKEYDNKNIFELDGNKYLEFIGGDK